MSANIRELHSVVIDGGSRSGYLALIFLKPTGAFLEINGKLMKRDELLTVLLSLRSLLKNN
jgi:hypothetical protein